MEYNFNIHQALIVTGSKTIELELALDRLETEQQQSNLKSQAIAERDQTIAERDNEINQLREAISQMLAPAAEEPEPQKKPRARGTRKAGT